MAIKKIPFVEVQALVKLVLETYNNQYGKNILPENVTPVFIPARTDTRIGVEVTTDITYDYLRLRLYAQAFVKIPNIYAYRLEDVQARPQDVGIAWKTFVTYGDLPIDSFPTLSKTLEPFYDNSVSIFAIELEDGSGYIQTETGEYLTTEDGPA